MTSCTTRAMNASLSKDGWHGTWVLGVKHSFKISLAPRARAQAREVVESQSEGRDECTLNTMPTPAFASGSCCELNAFLALILRSAPRQPDARRAPANPNLSHKLTFLLQSRRVSNTAPDDM
jgi:hypothetical protein